MENLSESNRPVRRYSRSCPRGKKCPRAINGRKRHHSPAPSSHVRRSERFRQNDNQKRAHRPPAWFGIYVNPDELEQAVRASGRLLLEPFKGSADDRGTP